MTKKLRHSMSAPLIRIQLAAVSQIVKSTVYDLELLAGAPEGNRHLTGVDIGKDRHDWLSWRS
jgi:hypothetical protein